MRFIFRGQLLRLIGCAISIASFSPVLCAHETEVHYEYNDVPAHFVLQSDGSLRDVFKSLTLGIYALQLVPCKEQGRPGLSWLESLSPISRAYANHGFHPSTPFTMLVNKSVDIASSVSFPLLDVAVPDMDYCRLDLIIGHKGTVASVQLGGESENSDESVSWRFQDSKLEENQGGVKFSMKLGAGWSQAWRFSSNQNRVVIRIKNANLEAVPKSDMKQAQAIRKGLIKAMTLEN